MRHAARTDANQAEIVKALKSVGISVEYIKLPFDLVVFNPRKRETAFVECKTEDGRLTKTQVDFISLGGRGRFTSCAVLKMPCAKCWAKRF
jgi:hypothetical protein